MCLTDNSNHKTTTRCCCGMDCAKCMIYRATVRDDEDLRIRAQKYYRETFGQDIPLEQFTCLGVHSDVVFPLCRECPWVQCCRRHGIVSCEACKDYPCAALREYRTKYVESYPITGK